MYVSKIDNQPSFEMIYVNKKSWNRNVLRTLEKSNLAKEIDRKYPAAYASYTKIFEEGEVNAEPNYHLSFILRLAKNKIWNVNFDSHTSEGVDRNFVKFLKQKSLQDIEKEAKPVITDLHETPGIKTQKQNPIKKFFKRFFR